MFDYHHGVAAINQPVNFAKDIEPILSTNCYSCHGDKKQKGGLRLNDQQALMKGGVTINRPPRDGNMAFVRSPDRHSIEILQKGAPLPPKEPWASMPNTGKW